MHDTRSITPAAGVEALGRSDAFLEFSEHLARAAKVDRPLIIVGERGTGKELAATRLHFLSPRWGGPLVALNCAALAPTLLESELFGHEAGAFTGAQARREGRFEQAHQGTLFLDEVALLDKPAQEKILRVVEYGEFERVGGMKPVSVDVRVVAATNLDLPGLADQGRFKRDLLDRLSFEVLTLPPLRNRGEDILLLARHFASDMAAELGLSDPPRFSGQALRRLEAYDWPGNVRELKNVVERAVYHSQGELIQDLNLDPFASPYRPLAGEPGPVPGQAPSLVAREDLEDSAGLLQKPLPQAVRELEVRALRAALGRTTYNQKRAADLLGLSYHQFRGLYRKYRRQVLPGAEDNVAPE